MEEKKVDFTEQIRIALSKPLWYKALFKLPVRYHVAYFVILTVLVTAIRCLVPMAAYIKSAGGLEEMVYQSMPVISFQDGILEVDSVVDIEKAGIRVIVDTSREQFTALDAENVANMMDDSLPVVYLIGRTNAVCNTVPVPIELNAIPFDFDNAWLYQHAGVVLGAWIIGFVLETVIGYIISAFFFAFFGLILNKALGLNLKFKQILLIAFYAKSLDIILEAILDVIGITLLYYIGTVVGIFITCNYMTRGMTSLVIKIKSKDKENENE